MTPRSSCPGGDPTPLRGANFRLTAESHSNSKGLLTRWGVSLLESNGSGSFRHCGFNEPGSALTALQRYLRGQGSCRNHRLRRTDKSTLTRDGQDRAELRMGATQPLLPPAFPRRDENRHKRSGDRHHPKPDKHRRFSCDQLSSRTNPRILVSKHNAPEAKRWTDN